MKIKRNGWLDFTVLVAGGLAIMIVLAIFLSRPGHSSRAAAPPPAPSASPSADASPSDPTSAGPAGMAISLCEGSVTSDLALNPEILTYSDVHTNSDDSKHYSVLGYVNDVAFSCSWIGMTKDGYWNQHAFDETVGGVEYSHVGDY